MDGDRQRPVAVEPGDVRQDMPDEDDEGARAKVQGAAVDALRDDSSRRF